MRELALEEGLIDFASNDYLGLAREEMVSCGPRGSTGSRLITGNFYAAIALEEKIARFHGYEAALLYTCGYMANVGLISSLKADVFLYDTGVHASMRDGLRLNQAASYPFRHNDLTHLEKRLQNSKGQVYILVESVYSIDGSLTPLEEMCQLADRYGAHLIVDEAHGVGVFGVKGEGLAPKVFAKIVTFGKALGCMGAAILSRADLREHQIRFSRTFIYTTAPSPHMINTIAQVYDLLPHLNKERKTLFEMMALLKIPSPILVLPGNRELFKKAGIRVGLLHEPREQIRICLHAFNTYEELEQLIRCLK